MRTALGLSLLLHLMRGARSFARTASIALLACLLIVAPAFLTFDAANAQGPPTGCRTTGMGNSIVCDTCASAATAAIADRQRILSGNENGNGTQGSNNAFCRITSLNPGDQLTLTVENLNSMNIDNFEVDYNRNGAMPVTLNPVSVLNDPVQVLPMSVPSVQSFSHSEAGAASTRINVNISDTQPSQVGQNSEVGATVTCSCTPATGTLTINKVAIGGDDTFPIEATPMGGMPIDFSITTMNGTGSNSQTVSPATYTVSETPPAGWILESIVCGGQTTDQAVVTANTTTTCTVTNRKLASVTIKKQTIGGTGTFDFSSTATPMGQAQLADFSQNTAMNNPSAGETFTNIAAGDYTFTETPPANGWALTNLTCSGTGVSNESTNGFAGSFTLADGAEAECTFVNTRQIGNLKVTKIATGANQNDLFTFEIRDDQNAQVGATFQLTDANVGQSMEIRNGLPTGPYTIEETNFPAGWALDDIDCGQRNGNAVTVDVTDGQTTECTFTNVNQVGALKITKQTIGGNDQFDFEVTNAQNAVVGTATNLANGDMQMFANLAPGDYTIEEINIPAGWTLTGADCAQLNGNEVTVSVTANQTTQCTFTNTLAGGSLTIVKDVPGAGDTTSFGFTHTGPEAPANFQLTDGASRTFTTLGVYSITEEITTGYKLTNLACTGTGANGAGDSTSIPNRRTVVNLAAGENITCTYRNVRQTGTITVRKSTIGGDDNFNFSVSGQPGFTLRNGGTRRYTGLTVGQYTIREANLPSGWELQNVACTGGGNRQGNGITVDLSANQSITCTFTNFKQRDDRMRDVTLLFVHRRVDNLLTHSPDRARMLRRLQTRSSGQNQVLCGTNDDCPDGSMKDPPPPLKLGGQAASRLGVGGASDLPEYSQPYSKGPSELFANGQEDDQPWDRRQGQSSPLLSSIMGQLSGAAGGATSFKFGTSLSELRQSAAAAEAQHQEQKLKGLGLDFNSQANANLNSNLRPGKFDMWVEGHVSRYDDSTGGIGREGNFRLLYVGADYAVMPGVLVGALVQVDDTREDVVDPTLTGEVEGTGWMVGPYIGIRLSDNLFFDARAAWGRSDNDIWLQDAATGWRSGSFETDRWLASATLTGNHSFGNWRFSPEIGIAYGDETYDTYFNSLGQTVDGGGASMGRVTGGAEIGYRIQMRDGSVLEPHVGIKGIWNFHSDDLVVGGVLVDTQESRARVEGGLSYRTPAGWAVRGAAAYDGIGGDDFEAVSGLLWVNIPLN